MRSDTYVLDAVGMRFWGNGFEEQCVIFVFACVVLAIGVSLIVSALIRTRRPSDQSQ